MIEYADFMESKILLAQSRGLKIEDTEIDPVLFDFQRDATLWALRKGRAGIFLDTGLGKTPIQLEWARLVPGRVLIVAPLSVAEQTIREAEKLLLNVPVYVHEPDEINDTSSVFITNYEHLHKFTHTELSGLVLDESSRLAAETSKTRRLACESFSRVPYRLACTATPIPNDIAEITNHAEFLGIMSRRAVLGAFFVHDEDGWRLRGHASRPFYRWLSSWALCMKRPDDLGYDGSAFVLPELTVREHYVDCSVIPEGELFPTKLKGIVHRSQVRRDTVSERVALTAKIANETKGSIIVWCGLNDESRAVAGLIPDCVEVKGSDSLDSKRAAIVGFCRGEHRILVTKAKIAGFGMNFQHAATQVFCGINDSWQSYYQAIRRSWRFGQTQPVTIHVVTSDMERQIVANVRRKEIEAETLTDEIIKHAATWERKELGMGNNGATEYVEDEWSGPSWELKLGDCVEHMKSMDESSIDLSVFSPPFIALYTYSESERDMGNAKDDGEFFEHFRFAVAELLRVTKPGRLAAVHCAQVAASLNNDGWIGLKDFRGSLVEEFRRAGWIYHGEVLIDKNPQAQAIRTHAKGLLFVQKEKDSSWLRPGLGDYICVFRKPGDNSEPIKSDVSNDEWVEWAHPVWYGIRESDTLNAAEARSDEDDRHVCPLQLPVIERCVRLWSAPGELVYDPFAGIGSTGYIAIKKGRRFLGTELKELYARTAVANMKRARAELNQGTLFEGTNEQTADIQSH